MNVWEFEKTVYELEEVRIVIRAPWRSQVADYGYERAASAGTSVTSWLEARVLPAIGDFEVVVLDGGGSVPHGRTRMSTLRDSYER